MLSDDLAKAPHVEEKIKALKEKMDPSAPPPIAEDPKGFLIWLRNKFLTGLMVAFPLIITGWILWIAFQMVSSLFGGLVRAIVLQFEEFLPGWLTFDLSIQVVGFALTLFLILLFGIFVSNFVGKRLMKVMDDFLLHLPVINTIYRLAKQIVDALQRMTRPGGLSGKQVVYIRYPGLNGYVIGFLTGRFFNAEGERMNAVFIPTAPNPITGFVMVFLEKDVLISDLDMDAAWRLLVSGGLVPPRKVRFPVRPISTIAADRPPAGGDTPQTE